MEKGNVRRMRAEHLLDRTIAGYRLLEILGKGGMGIVFLAEPEERSESKVAIKILMPPDISTTGEFASFKARFQREALAAHQLHHEHILPVQAYGEEDNLCYMVMPMLTGGTLARRLSSASEALPLDEIARYLTQLSRAVDYAHQNGMIHRDIKPSNVLTDEAGNAYLADFGIVHLFDSGHQGFDQELTSLTTTGKIYGTPAYMAPERYKGEPAEPATDIYALGILLYQLVSGQIPFDADNPLALGMKHLNEDPLPPRSLRPELPAPAEGAILKAIAKAPLDRFITASALAYAFEAGLKDEWAGGLQPAQEMLAVRMAETTVKRAVATGATLPEVAQPVPLVLPQASEMPGSDLPLEFVPTVTDVPVVARSESRPRRSFQLIMLGLLGVALFLFIGLLAFAAYKFANPGASAPALHSISTATSKAPTKTNITPVSSTGVTPASKSTPASKGTTTPAPSSGNTPVSVPTAGSSPTSAPTSPAPPPTAPAPTATPASSPPATPTAQGTP